MRIAPRIVPAVFVYALRRGDGDVFITVFLKKQSALQKELIDEGVDSPVMVEICVGRFAVDLIDDRFRKADADADGKAAVAEIAVFDPAESDVGRALFDKIGL